MGRADGGAPRARHRIGHGHDSRDGGDPALRVPHALSLAAVVALALVVPGAAAQTTGDLRTLVILATWGPQPWEAADVRRIVFDDADEFLRRSSFGQVSLYGDVTPWLSAYAQRPACPEPLHERVAPALSDPPVQAAARAGYAPSSYDRVIYVVPSTECPWRAVGVGREVFLNGELSPWHVVHELGHTFGLAHARGLRCASAGVCVTDEYWLEQRLDVDPPGLAVRTVEPDVPDDDLAPPTRFVFDPARTRRPVVKAGETFTAPGAFSARYSSSGDLQFAWTDRLRPTRPTLRAPGRRVAAGRPSRVEWSTSRDTGSGVAFCVVTLNGRAVARVEDGVAATVGPVKAGFHRIAVTCTDRAGNPSLATTKRIQALQP